MADQMRPTIDLNDEAHMNFSKYMSLAKMARQNAEQLGRAGKPWAARSEVALANAISWGSR